MRFRALALAAVGGTALLSFAAVGHAAVTKPFASDVSRNPAFMEGEPTVAVNPTDPRNVLVTYTRIGEPYQFRPSHALTNEACGLAVSQDGGKTFQRRLLPVTDVVHNSCGDPYAVFDKRGTAYISFDVWDMSILDNRDGVIRSIDGGKTWSDPVFVIRPIDGPRATGPGLNSYVGPAWTTDRPWIAVDDSTGTLYLSGDDLTETANLRGHRYISASHDGGRTWSKVTAVDSKQYPGGGGAISASHGAIYVAYGAPVTPTRFACTCVVLATSTDAGRTFAHRPLPFDLDGAQVSADPSRAGRLAITGVSSATGQLEVRVSTDRGRTWSSAVALTATGSHFKPWSTYSRTGVLGVAWRTRYDDNSYDVWATISTDGGRHFQAPVQISLGHSPAPKQASIPIGDDFSQLLVEGHHLRAGWGDWRQGGGDAWVGGFDF